MKQIKRAKEEDYRGKIMKLSELAKLLKGTAKSKFHMLMAEVKHFEEKRIPRCPHCKKNFIKIDDYTWKPNCKHCKNLRLNIG